MTHFIFIFFKNDSSSYYYGDRVYLLLERSIAVYFTYLSFSECVIFSQFVCVCVYECVCVTISCEINLYIYIYEMM